MSLEANDPTSIFSDDSPLVEEGGLETLETDEQASPTEPKKPDQATETIMSKLDSVLGNTQNTKVLADLLADPDISAVLQLKKAGKPVSISSTTTAPKDEVTTPLSKAVNLDDLSNTELTRTIIDNVQQIVRDTVTNSLNTLIKPLEQKISSTEGYIQKQQLDTIGQQIEQAKQKYPDFESFRGDMVELSKQNSGLTIEELYLLSRHRKGGSIASDPRLHSERPTVTGTRSVKPVLGSAATKPGALSNVIAASLENHFG